MLMNLIVTSPSPQTCARNLDNFTLEQQLLTVSVLLSRYAYDCSYEINGLYRFIKKNHPFMRWLNNHEANIDWLKEYGIILHCEYSSRTSKRHAGSDHVFGFIDDFQPPIGLEPIAFMNRAWDELSDFRTDPDVFRAYRNMMNHRWAHTRRQLSWGDRMPPAWYIEDQIARGVTDKNLMVLDDNEKEPLVAYTVTTGTSTGSNSSVSRKKGIPGGCDVH